jgi:hypothetical protein
MSWYDSVGNFFGVGNNDTGAQYRNALTANGQAAGNFGGQLANNYQNNQAGINSTIGQFQNLANGNDSVSMEQARQNLARGQAQQMSMAASAAPQNQGMAARTAMIGAGNLASGVMGQQALAGLQERQNALASMGQLQTTQSGQNINGAIGAYGASNQAYGTNLQNKPQSWWQGVVGPLVGGAMGAAGGAAGGMGG